MRKQNGSVAGITNIFFPYFGTPEEVSKVDGRNYPVDNRRKQFIIRF